jgi:DNA-binding MarR family transcriptional regulator
MTHELFLILEILLTVIILLAVSVLYTRINIPEVRFRLSFLIAAFAAFLVALLFHAAAARGVMSEVSLFYEHVFGIVFFTLLGSTGLLHFLEKRYQGLVAKATYAFVGLLLLLSTGAQAYAMSHGEVYQLGIREIIISHVLQIGILLLVTGIILRRIMVTHSYLTPLTIHRRYPFGIAAVLMMFAVAAHIGSITISPPEPHLISFFESALVLPALAIIASYIVFSYRSQIGLYVDVHMERCECEYCRARREYREVWGMVEALNHVVRQVYYTPVDVGIGAREVLFSEFLNTTGLAPLFSKNRMELRKTKFLAIPNKYETLYEVSGKILEFFVAHRELVNEAQLYHLVNFLDSLYAHRGDRAMDFKLHWTMLSRLVNVLGAKGREHVERLSNWDAETTFSYFERLHPVGIPALDEYLGGVETHQFLLNVSSEVSRGRILGPVVKNALRSWRNVVYITSDPVAKILRDFRGEGGFIQEGRLRIITLMEGEKPASGIEFSSLGDLIASVRRCVREFPLCTVFLVINLNPIIISSSPPELHAFVKELTALRFEERMVVCAMVTKNIPPLSMDILREEADIVVVHSLVNGKHVAEVVKPEQRRGEPLERDLFEVLRLVYEENNRGRKPSISDVSKAVSITPKTARKRIDSLRRMGLVDIEKSGRYRVVRLTDRGRQRVLLER